MACEGSRQASWGHPDADQARYTGSSCLHVDHCHQSERAWQTITVQRKIQEHIARGTARLACCSPPSACCTSFVKDCLVPRWTRHNISMTRCPQTEISQSYGRACSVDASKRSASMRLPLQARASHSLMKRTVVGGDAV
jgi:hypothetical protein